MNIEAIYIHIPFCVKKCNYCDFTSYPIEDNELIQQYCDAVISEAALYAQETSASNNFVKSIYIGGGTPSSLKSEDLVRIFHNVQRHFPLGQNGELTVECNPNTVNKDYFLELKKAGVNRISIGAQAFQDSILKSMGRIHKAGDIESAVINGKRAGFENINIDLMYGVPNQTMQEWQHSLEMAVAMEIPHIAAYGLKLEKETPWGKLYEQGDLEVPNQDISGDMLEFAMDYLSNKGYIHYEISNFAKPGFFSRHNTVYWRNGEYLGLGVAAASHFNNMRQSNIVSLPQYLETVQNGRLPVNDIEELDKEMIIAETIFLGLRLLSGLDLNEFQKRLGVNITEKYKKQVEKLCKYNLLELSETHLKLTRKGIFLANEVFMEFLP